MSYNEEVYTRTGRSIEGIEDWLWIRGDGGPNTDGGAWLGPREDWIHSHSKKFFTHVKDFNICIQAGGNLGLYPRLLSSRFKLVYTFEPDPLNFHCLVNNCQVDNVIKINAALGAENGFCKIQRNHRSNVGMHRIEVADDGAVPVMSIDSLNFPCCDMICLDTEGFEYNIIQGAVKTIEKYKPVITCENKEDSKDVLELISQYGYKKIDQSVSDSIFAVE